MTEDSPSIAKSSKWLTKLSDLLSQLPLAAIKEAQIALMRQQALDLEKRMETLEKENAELKEEATQLRNEIAKYKEVEQHIEKFGVLVKRETSGGYSSLPICPSCKRPLATTPSNKLFCSGCGFIASNSASDIARQISLLNTTK